MADPLFSDLIWLNGEGGDPIDFGDPHGPANLVSDILPANSGPFERALAVGMSDGLPVPLTQILDPATTPKRTMLFLAGHESVDLWYSDWPDDLKRRMIADAPLLAQLIGTREAAQRFLDYVGAEIIHKVSYPAAKPIGRIAVRLTPIQMKAFVARYLVKVILKANKNAICVGRTAIGRASIRPPSREPILRAMKALSLSKSPDTAYTINFAHRIPRSLDDGIDLDAGYTLGEYRDRLRL